MERIVVCNCGKEIKINKYKGNTSPYVCNKDRTVVHQIDSCSNIMKDTFIKKNGYKMYFCKSIKNFVTIRTCKECKK